MPKQIIFKDKIYRYSKSKKYFYDKQFHRLDRDVIKSTGYPLKPTEQVYSPTNDYSSIDPNSYIVRPQPRYRWSFKPSKLHGDALASRVSHPFRI